MKNKTLLLLACLFNFMLSVKCQIPDGLIDSTCVKNQISEVYEYIESVDSLAQRKNSFRVFFIFESSLLDNDINDTLITKQYYLEGTFLKDIANLKQQQKKKASNYSNRNVKFGLYFDYYTCLVYDTDYEIAYRYNGHLTNFFDQQFYNFIGKLFYCDMIDHAFFHTSIVEKPSVLNNHFESLRYLVFAIKGNQFYVIRQKDDGCMISSPSLLSLEDYIDCCWEEMTNLPLR